MSTAWHCAACNCHNARQILKCLKCGASRESTPASDAIRILGRLARHYPPQREGAPVVTVEHARELLDVIVSQQSALRKVKELLDKEKARMPEGMTISEQSALMIVDVALGEVTV